MTLADDLDLEEYIAAKDDLSGADIKVNFWVTIVQFYWIIILMIQSFSAEIIIIANISRFLQPIILLIKT